MKFEIITEYNEGLKSQHACDELATAVVLFKEEVVRFENTKLIGTVKLSYIGKVLKMEKHKDKE